jgi:Mn2+/Fe2+ NRAMP family transporter
LAAVSASSDELNTLDPPTGVGARVRQIGPGIMAAATGVGAGDLVATMVAGSKYGYLLFWAVIVGTVFKLVLAEGVGRWHLASDTTMMYGWRRLGRWALVYFGVYAVIWGFVYGATAMSASGLPLNALFPGLSLRYWAMICGVVALLLIWFGRYALIEKIMTVFVGIMFVTVVGTAILVGPNLLEIGNGLVPRLPHGSIVYVLGLIGGVGGTITMAAYGYWTMSKGWRGPKWLSMMRTDNAAGYVMTGIFVLAMLVIGAELLLGQNIIDGDKGLVQLAGTLEQDYGAWARIPFLIGFFAVSFTSVIGVWNGVSLLFADWWRTWRLPKDAGEPEYTPTAIEQSKVFRGYVLWLTFPPMALLFLDKPFGLTVVYGVLGSLFMPFLAITLLILLNSRHLGSAHRSKWLSNVLLGICVVFFAVVAVNELIGEFQ